MFSLYKLSLPLLVLFGLPFFLLGLFLLVIAETWPTRIYSLAVIHLFAFLFLQYTYHYFDLFQRRRHHYFALFSSFLLFCITLYLIPQGENKHFRSFQSYHLFNSSYQSFSPFQWIPEIDQIKAATMLLPLVDPHLDNTRAPRIQSLLMKQYLPLQTETQFTQVGSVLNQSADEILFNQKTVGHLYQYIPQSPVSKPLPVLLFLHGSLGNLKAYQWYWKTFAEEHGFAIVSPSFGLGNWHYEGGMKAIEIALARIRKNPQLNSEKIYLAGLSTGGFGVSRGALAFPHSFAGLIYLSAVLESSLFTSKDFADATQNTPILYISGEKDPRLPRSQIEQTLSAGIQSGLNPTVKFFKEEDDFLLLSNPEETTELIIHWINNTQTPFNTNDISNTSKNWFAKPY